MKGTKQYIPTERKTEKIFSSIKLIYLVLFLLSLGVVILTLSGIFDSPRTGVKVNTGQNASNNLQGGADTTALKQIKQYEEHLTHNPNDFRVILELGHLLNDNGFFEEAIKRYKQFLVTYPKEADVLVDMGVCYFNLKDYSTAIKSMEEAIKINSNHQIACLNLGIINLSANNREKAIQWWEKAVSIDPNTDAGQKATKLLNSN